MFRARSVGERLALRGSTDRFGQGSEDNVVRNGAVIAEHPDASAEGMRQALALIAAEPRLSATAIQTVGGKGYDGFAIALVN